MDIYIYMHVHIHIYAQACTPVEIYHAMTYIHKITCTIYIHTHTQSKRCTATRRTDECVRPSKGQDKMTTKPLFVRLKNYNHNLNIASLNLRRPT